MPSGNVEQLLDGRVLVPFLIASNEKPYDTNEWEIFANSIDDALNDFTSR